MKQEYFGPSFPGKIISPVDAVKLRWIHNYIVTTLTFIVPLLNLFYGLHRYVIITHPQLITRYCNKKATLAAIVGTIFIGGVLSIHELFDTSSFSLFGLNSFFLIGKIEKWHQKFSGLISIVALFSEVAMIFVLFSLVTKKMNECLSENITFLNSMDGVKYETRVVSYQKIMKLNSGFLVVSMISVSVEGVRALLVDLYNVQTGLKPAELHNSIITNLLLMLEFLSCF